MGVEHTMVTYTRCMDSALCVPLMIDAAVFCAHFADRAAPAADAAAALAYLFKLNEGAAEGVDPGSSRRPPPSTPSSSGCRRRRRSRRRRRPPAGGGGASARLGAVRRPVLPRHAAPRRRVADDARGDRRLRAVRRPRRRIDLEHGGGARGLGARAAVLGVVGDDGHGAELRRQWAAAGVDASLVVTTTERSTSLAVLPVFAGGGRGCWVDLSANELLDDGAALAAMRAPAAAAALGGCRAIHVGYPTCSPGCRATLSATSSRRRPPSSAAAASCGASTSTASPTRPIARRSTCSRRRCL